MEQKQNKKDEPQGVNENEPLISLNEKPEDMVDLFNVSEDRYDEIDVAMRRAMRNLWKQKRDISSDEIVRAFVKVAKTPEELALVCCMAGTQIEGMRHHQEHVMRHLGGILGHVVSLGFKHARKPGRGHHSADEGMPFDNIDDFLDEILRKRGNKKKDDNNNDQ